MALCGAVGGNTIKTITSQATKLARVYADTVFVKGIYGELNFTAITLLGHILCREETRPDFTDRFEAKYGAGNIWEMDDSADTLDRKIKSDSHKSFNNKKIAREIAQMFTT
ncbi:hypothetical protein GJ496_003209 [Pomphorhynchus laevis]|nr:hypothetical protein GJ496_003209 [Pomphorhynchus laevis]